MRSAVSGVVLSWVLVGCGGGDGGETSSDPDSATVDAVADVTSDVPTDALGDTGAGDGGAGDTGAGDAGADAVVDTAPPSTRCAPLALPAAFVEVTDKTKLVQTVFDAAAGSTIVLPDGTYDLGGKTLQLHSKGVTLRGKSGDRTKVILDAGYSTAAGDAIQITADDVTVAHLTVRRAYDHPIHVYGLATADVKNPRVYDVHVLDPGQQGIKVNANAAFDHFVDGGLVACSRIELTDAGRTKVRDSCYTGGIDIHASRGWVIRDNVVEGFFCASGLSEHGIHLWKGGRDNVVERNVIKDCARGIGFGLGESTVGRTYAGLCGGATLVGQYGGVIRNNTVFAGSAALFASAASFDTGIALEQACETVVAHNTVFSTSAPVSSSFEWRFARTNARFFNNLASHAFKDRGAGAVATRVGDQSAATAALFVDASKGDLHLVSTASVKDKGVAVPAGLCDDDLDAMPRTSLRDVGADELP